MNMTDILQRSTQLLFSKLESYSCEFCFWNVSLQCCDTYLVILGPSWVALVIKSPPANAGDTDSIPGSGRSPGGGPGNPLRYSCMENPLVRGAWRATVHGVTKRHNQKDLAHTQGPLRPPDKQGGAQGSVLTNSPGDTDAREHLRSRALSLLSNWNITTQIIPPACLDHSRSECSRPVALTLSGPL